eukprot:INCI16338.4.p1 GENE.INCI16338.4~~INCI16338.4.p1  ORF type:complete len:399 (+),score=61.48 INCI16338.4:383-1579(+)
MVHIRRACNGGVQTPDEDSLCASALGMKDGGTTKGVPKAGIRDTKVYPEDFGPWLKNPATRSNGMIDPDNPVQFGHYPNIGEDDEGRYDSCGPHFCADAQDTPVSFTVPEDWTKGTPLTLCCSDGAPSFVVSIPDGVVPGTKCTAQRPRTDKGKEWWRGVRKGKAQLLWETGWIDPNLTSTASTWINNWGKHKPTEQEQRDKKRASDGKLNAELHLASRRDFREEQSVIEKLVSKHGHILQASPRYHPEVAGLGIEYSWGKAKWCFRRYVNDLKSANLEKNVLISLGDQPFKMHGSGAQCEAPLELKRVRKFARRARTYRLLFEMFPTVKDGEQARKAWKEREGAVYITDKEGRDIAIGPARQSGSFYAMIDKMYNVLKTHGNLIDMDFKFCVQGGSK